LARIRRLRNSEEKLALIFSDSSKQEIFSGCGSYKLHHNSHIHEEFVLTI
jgi:hypothetical protein